MNKFWSDYLPPALVRDLRRSWRTRGYIVMLVLALLIAVWLQYSATQAETATGVAGWSLLLLSLGCVMIWGVVPNRAGAAVSADAKVKGTNFMMLTPLSSRNIVWATWFSAACQVLLLAAFGALLMCWRHATAPLEPLTNPLMDAVRGGGVLNPLALSTSLTHEQEWIIYGIVVGIGVMLCAVFMFLAQLSRFFRLAASAFAVLVLLSVVWNSFVTTAWLTDENYSPVADFLAGFTGASLWLRVVDAVLVLVLLLELARRSYAAPAENCSRVVRLLTLVVLASVPVVYYLLPGEAKLLEAQMDFCLVFGMVAALSDALLPTYSLVAHNKRAWPVVPTYLQTPGVGQAALFLVLFMVAYRAMMVWQGQISSGDDVMYEGPLPGVIEGAKVLYVLLLGLFLTDVLCSRTNVNRPIVYVVLLMVMSFIVTTVTVFMPWDTPAYVYAVLPFVSDRCLAADSITGLDETLQICCASITGGMILLLLVLLMLRGRR